MATITLEVPEELSNRLSLAGEEVARLHGLTTRAAELQYPSPYGGVSEIIRFLAGLPSPEEVLALEAAKPLHRRISNLLEKNRTAGLTPAEEQEMDQYEALDHLVRIAKTKARTMIHEE